MKADYYRYIAEFRSGDEKSKAAEEARKAYADAAKVAKDDLAVTRRAHFPRNRFGIEMISLTIGDSSQSWGCLSFVS